MANDLRIQATLTDNLSPGLNTITNSLGKTKKQVEDSKRSLQGLSSSVSAARNSLMGLFSSL